MTMSTLLFVAASVEAATGLALVIHPSIVAQFLLGEGLTGVGIVVGRVGGLGLLTLGMACWPRRTETAGKTPPRRAMLSYNLLVSMYLVVLGIGGQTVGVLLWPAFAFHAVVALLLARAWFAKP